MTRRAAKDLTGGGVVAPTKILPAAGERPPMSPKARREYIAGMRCRYAAAAFVARRALLDAVWTCGRRRARGALGGGGLSLVDASKSDVTVMAAMA